MNESRKLASFLTSLAYTDLSNEVIEKTKDLVLDQLGIELAASTKPWSVVVYDYVRGLGGSGESTIVNYGNKVRAENAAFANATFGHGFEMDDTYLPSAAHLSCVVVPTALAIGERDHIDGKDFLLAVVTGCEAMGRIGRSVAPSYVGRGFHSTGVVGPFGAAAVVGKLLHFGEELMLNAISIAGSHSSGLHECTQTGDSVKRVHAGIAAFGGIRAALLAKAGIIGPATVLEGKKGFWHAFSDEYHPEKLTSDLGKEFIVTETSYKLHACGHLIHSAIDATSKIVKEHDIRPNDIEEMVVGTSKHAITVVGTILEPEDVTDCQFSTVFSLAMCVVKGSNGFRDYNEENLRDPDIRKLARRIRLEVDDEVDAMFPANRAVRMTVKLKNDTIYQEKLDWLRGTPENPATKSEVENKFRDLATIVLPNDRVEEIFKIVEDLDEVGNVSTLCNLLISENGTRGRRK